MDNITLQDQLDVLSDLRKPTSHDRFATIKQLQKINIALRAIVGDEFRVAVLRLALGYGETFRSTKQLYFSDAHGLIEWLWDSDDSPTDEPSKAMSVQTLLELKQQYIAANPVEVINGAER